jgi:hypothetical protein
VSIHSSDLSPVRVQVGIDAAVVANHHICVREVRPDGQVRLTRFLTPPTLPSSAASAPTPAWWPWPSRPR